MNSRRIIYLVDDDPSARKGLKRLLDAGGYNVEAFSSFDKFLQIQATDSDACLIMDTRVSDLSGTELHNTLAKKHRHLPVIFLSAHHDKESRDKARAAKAAGFFRKPIDGPALLDAITWALETHDQESFLDTA